MWGYLHLALFFKTENIYIYPYHLSWVLEDFRYIVLRLRVMHTRTMKFLLSDVSHFRRQNIMVKRNAVKIIKDILALLKALKTWFFPWALGQSVG